MIPARNRSRKPNRSKKHQTYASSALLKKFWKLNFLDLFQIHSRPTCKAFTPQKALRSLLIQFVGTYLLELKVTVLCGELWLYDRRITKNSVKYADFEFCPTPSRGQPRFKSQPRPPEGSFLGVQTTLPKSCHRRGGGPISAFELSDLPPGGAPSKNSKFPK